MKIKRFIVLILAMIIGIIPIVFAGCGGVDTNNLSITMITKEDSVEGDFKVINLSVDDEEQISRELTFQIVNWQDGMSAGVTFSTDSNAVEISDRQYLSDGRVKIKITAKSGGSAIITATTQQYSKQTSILVRISEKISDFNLKNNIETIYFEKGSELKLNAENLFNFYPSSTTQRELKAYNGENLITNENGEHLLSGLEEDTTITFVSENLDGISRNVYVKVIEKLENDDILLEKLMLSNKNESSYTQINSGDTLQILKNNNAKTIENFDVAYNERQIKLTINCNQTDLKVKAVIYTKDGNNWVRNDLIVANIVQNGTLTNGKYEHIFKFEYAGFNQMKVVFTYQIGEYTYSTNSELYFDCAEVPTNLAINKDISTNQEITIYDPTEGYIGKNLTFAVYPQNCIDYNINLLLNANADSILKVLNSKGINKAREDASEFGYKSKISLSNNESIKISAINAVDFKSVDVVAEIRYTFENVTYVINYTIKVNIKRSPTAMVITDDKFADGELAGTVTEYTKYIFDLNSGKILDENGNLIDNFGKNTLKLYVYAELDGILESGHDFAIVNNLGIVNVEKNEDNEILITAKSVGVGSFFVVLDNGMRKKFDIEVIESLSNLELSFPTPTQNSNIYLNKKSSESGYLFEIIALTGAKIPPIVVKNGNLISYDFAGEGFNYTNGYIIGQEDTDGFVECSFTATHYYLDSNNEKQVRTTTYKFKIMFYSRITNFSVTTNKGSTNFDLYNLANVGYYSEQLATAIITINIGPDELRESILKNIKWQTNVGWDSDPDIDGDIVKYSNKVFTFTFNTATGTGTIICNVAKMYENENGELVPTDYFDENGNFRLGKVVLTATIEREQGGQELDNLTKSIQFDILNKTPVEEIVASVNSINIDRFKGTMSIFTTVYPVSASNKELRAIFIPNDLSYANAIQFKWVGDKLEVTLDTKYQSGQGIIRLIAIDSYSTSETFTTYLDIPLVICDGSEEYPFQIMSEKDLRIMIETNFEKNYNIIGTIDISKFVDSQNNGWEYSQYILKGKIKGINNACFTGIEISSKSTSNSYGLFAGVDANASIENVKFEGKIDLDLSSEDALKEYQEINIGLVAGYNKGVLKNIYVLMNTSSLRANYGYKINLGCVVGSNEKEIIIDNDANYNRLVNFEKDASFTIIDCSPDNDATHTLFVGGVAGKNTWIITSSIQSNTMLVYINFELKYEWTGTGAGKSHRLGDHEAIGGVAGLSEYPETTTTILGISGMTVEGQIVAGKMANNKFIGHFNNVGGLVGENSLNITNCVSQVVVKGRENVGGGIGFNNGGSLLEIKIQALEKGDLTLVIGNNNVGGIVGQFADGSIEKSTFITYISKSFDATNYLGDIVVYDTAISSQGVHAGRIVGLLNNNIRNINYVVAIANLKADCEINLPINVVSTENIAIYGKNNILNITSDANFINDNFLKKLVDEQSSGLTLSGISNLNNFIEKIILYENWAKTNNKEILTSFIVLPPTRIDQNLTEKGKKQQLTTTKVNGELIFYLTLHQKSDGSLEGFSSLNKNEYEIKTYITVKANSNTNLVFTSSDESVLLIEDGKFKVLRTGLVKVTVTSEFNTSLSKHFYVYVVRYVDDFTSFRKPDRESSELTSGTYEVLNKGTSYMMYFKYLNKYNVKDYYESQEILVAVRVDGRIIFATGETDSVTGLRFTRISNEAYQLTATKLQSEFKEISFIYYFETKIGDDVYNRIAEIDGVEYINFKYKVINETTKISVSDPDIEVMPFYQPQVDVELVSENENEKITILSYLVSKDGTLSASLNFKYKIWVNKELQKSNEFEINARNYKTFRIQFYLEENAREIKSDLTFKVVIRTSNNLETSVLVNFKPQKPNDITVDLYPEKSNMNDEVVSIPNDEMFSYIASNKIVPGTNSLLEFIIFPAYSNYDYILIKNFASNEYKLVFELYDRATNKAVLGSQDVDGGIKVLKSAIKNGCFGIRIFLDSRITDFSTVSIEIDVIKDEKSLLDKKVTKTFYVEQLPGVKVEVDGVKSGNTADNPLRVALGLDYDMKLIVKGYSDGVLTFDQASSTYSDGELRFVLSDAKLATIVKNSDGTYSLKINKNATGKLVITTYGEQLTTTGVKKSDEVSLYIDIVEFVIKQSINGGIIKEIDNGVIYSAVGNTYTFEATLNSQILIYDKTNAQIIEKVQQFIKDISSYSINGHSWFVKDVNQVYYGWSQITQDSFGRYAELSNNAYEVRIENNKVKIVFKKVQSESNPTLLFKFERSYYYDNGKPRVGRPTGGQYFTLMEEFVFDIAEKTNIRNPYPIYSVKEFLNMREGNYYILMNDIELPKDFTPITTNIGGFDGNNYNIKMTAGALEYNNTGNNQQFNFGLFETISEGALIANVRLYIEGEITIDLTSYPSINFGLIAANNYGTITNCAVVGSTYAHIIINVKDTVNSSDEPSHIVAGFVATNGSTGAISNSRVEVSITSKGNIAGFVYSNSGTIASSYVYGSIINNTVSTTSKTAGFVGINEYGGLIFTSYIAGDYVDNHQFSTSTSKVVYTAHRVGAFVYTNSGKISNCYANIPVSSAASRASGFAYINEKSGEIEYSYSSCLMASNRNSHTSFIGRSAEALLNRGTIKECFALEDAVLNINVRNDNEVKVEFANSKLGSNDNISGLTILRATFKEIYNDNNDQNQYYYYNDNGTKQKICQIGQTPRIYNNSDFVVWSNEKLADPETFAKFALSNDSTNTNGVWFFAKASTEQSYVNDGKYLVLKTGRPELVSPNLIVSGHQTFSHTSLDETTGETIYHYISAENLGGLHNPYIISSVDDLELIAENKNNLIGEDKYYRLVNDIIYETGTISSKLYKYYFLGNLEGNSFTIGNYVIDSSENMEFAGFFAGIGSRFKQMGSIKNVNFAPRYINLPNTNSVGAIAGVIFGANIINVNIDGFTYDNEGIVILGKNAVGGVAGVALGNYLLNNIKSNISVNATYRAKLSAHDVQIFDEFNLNSISHAGLIVGAVGGYGKANYIQASGDNVAIGECVGMLFGSIGKNVEATDLVVKQSSKQSIKADIYAGVIAGVSAGKLSNILVDKNEISKNSFFADTIYIPIAIGNVVGYVVGGSIENAIVNTTTYVPSGVTFVGGAFGIMQDGSLKNIVINGNISAGEVVGGVVGYIGIVEAKGYTGNIKRVELAKDSKISITDCYLVGNIVSTTSTNEVRVGTVAGLINGVSKDDVSISDINVKSNAKVTITFSDGLVLTKNIISISNYSYNTTSVSIRYGIVTTKKATNEGQILYEHIDANKNNRLYIEKPYIFQINSENGNIKVNDTTYAKWDKIGQEKNA